MSRAAQSRRWLGCAVVAFLAAVPARADVVVTPSSVAFGSQAVGTVSAPVSVTLTNTGSRRVRFTSVTVTSSAFIYSGPTGAFNLDPQQTVSVAVASKA